MQHLFSGGLPEGQMGNSEVGHTNIGQDELFTKVLHIDKAIEDGEFVKNDVLLDTFNYVKQKDSALIYLVWCLTVACIHIKDS